MIFDWLDPTVLTAIFLIFLGSFVQTAIGFGLAIVAAPLLFQLSPDYVPAPICLVALFISILNALKHRANVSIGGLKMALIGRVPGSIAGGMLLLVVSTDVLSLWLGFLVLFAVMVSMLPFRIEPTPIQNGDCRFFLWIFWHQLFHRWTTNGASFTTPRRKPTQREPFCFLCVQFPDLINCADPHWFLYSASRVYHDPSHPCFMARIQTSYNDHTEPT